jgi:hypothetical protein
MAREEARSRQSEPTSRWGARASTAKVGRPQRPGSMPRTEATSFAAPGPTHAVDRTAPDPATSVAGDGVLAGAMSPGQLRLARAAGPLAATSRSPTSREEETPPRAPVEPRLLAVGGRYRGRHGPEGSAALALRTRKGSAAQPDGSVHCTAASAATQTQRCRRDCWKPGEPHGRLQGATDLHCARGASRRSREKRQGRNRIRAWHARTEGAPRSREARKARRSLGTRARQEPLPASAGTPFGRGRWSTGSGHVQQLSTERQSLRSPMRGVRQDSPLTSPGRPAPRPGRVGGTLR